MPTPIHARRQIREAVADVCTGLATTGTRVHQSRMRPTLTLPALLIETNSENVSLLDLSNIQNRVLEIVVHGLVKAAADVDDKLDTIALEVETAMAAAGNFGGKIKGNAELQNISISFDELEHPVGVVSLKYIALYITNAGSPGTLL